jgi:GR25 family glycosyltransferase involved in LPS biosynthesis
MILKNVLYINLAERTDRKEYVEKQLQSVGLRGERFAAVKLQNGAAGCTMSHIQCLELAKKRNWDHVIIVEDDITFLNPGLFATQLNLFLSSHKTWDVVLFGGNLIPPYTKVDSCCVQVEHCQTTTGYLVKKHYYEILIQNFKDGLRNLLKEPENKKMYAIDRFWFSLQERHKWYLIIPLTVTQKENDFSDIEQKNTNYSRLMLDMNKPWLLPNIHKK